MKKLTQPIGKEGINYISFPGHVILTKQNGAYKAVTKGDINIDHVKTFSELEKVCNKFPNVYFIGLEHEKGGFTIIDVAFKSSNITSQKRVALLESIFSSLAILHDKLEYIHSPIFIYVANKEQLEKTDAIKVHNPFVFYRVGNQSSPFTGSGISKYHFISLN